MRPRITTTAAISYGLLALAGTVSLVLPDRLSVGVASGESAPPASPTTIRLPSIIHDFRKTDAEFITAPSAGNGHYAGNIALALNVARRPSFVGGGFKVAAEWKDKAAHPICPNLYMGAGAGVSLVSAPTVDANAFFDSWDSFRGPYGGANVGPMPTISTGSTMPAVSAPNNLGPSSGNVMYVNTVALSNNLHCSSLTTNKNTIVNVTGNVTILCESNFTLGQHTTVNLMPASRLNVYVKGQISINQGSIVNMNTFDPDRVTFYNLGTSTVEINQSNQVCATIVSPKAGIHLAQNDNVYGTFIGTTMKLDQTTGFHWDGIQHVDSCGVKIKDVAGTKGVTSTGGIPSATAFMKWYNDTPDVNMSKVHWLEMTMNSSGVYEYLDDAFHPIDGQLLGNQGQSHNFFFTLMMEVPFRHHSCSSRFFEFQGADDAWLFINGQLVMDLGGVVPGTSQYVDMDRLNLADGQQYTMNFFYAQRQGSIATFHMRTNLDLIVAPVYNTVSAPAD